MRIQPWSWSLLWGTALFLSATVVHSRAIMGIDLGSLYMKVALVQSGSPLEIVTNLHSKRKTESMILFDNAQRFYGADANALIARKSQKTPTSFNLFLGRELSHPVVQAYSQRHFPVVPYYNETRFGVELTVNKEIYTPEELTAMVLQHASDISVAYATESGSNIAPPKDCVITVPSFATLHVRRAYLDAATLAGLNVLGLMEENTAAALQYAMDKNFEQPQLFLFYNMGGSSVQVSVVKFFQYDAPQKYGKPKSTPALEVLGKAWDETVGGLAFDHVVVEYLADEFNKVWHEKDPSKAEVDIRTIPRAMTKLRLEANKIKHVLSANTERPVYLDSVHDDIGLQTHLTRSQLEELSADLLQRVVAPIQKALKVANVTVSDLTGMELVGGGMRIPKIQASIQKELGSLELGLHMNADEAFALGAAFAGANVSTAFRVRQVGLTDVNPFGISVSLSNLQDEDSKTTTEEEEKWSKQANIFKSWGRMGVKKTIAFTHDQDVHCELDYAQSDELPEGSRTELERFDITGVQEFAKEMEEKGLGKPKVSLQFELSGSGVTSLLKAEASVEETYTVEEEVEVDDEEAVSNATDDASAKEDDKKKEESKEETKEDDKKSDDSETTKNETDTNKKDKKEEKKPKKKIKVEKEKKKLHKKSLSVKRYFSGPIQPLTEDLMAESKAKLDEMAEKDKERVLLEESKNKVESYIYKVKNKLIDDEDEIEAVTTKKQREEVKKLAEKAEEWLYEDGYDADLATMEDKYAELSVPFEKILLRISENVARPAAIEKMQAKLGEIEALMAKWVETKPQVTEEERTKVLDGIDEVRKWIEDKEKAQKKKKPHDEPAFLSTEVPEQSKSVETMVVRLNRKPKPKPPKVEKNETEATNTTDSNTTESNATEANATETPEESTPDSATESTPDDASSESKGEAESSEEGAESKDGEPVKEEL